jgi:transketolase
MNIMSKLTADWDGAAALWKKLADSKSDESHRPSPPQKLKHFAMPDAPDADMSTREMFGMVIRGVVAENPDIVIGGSADLSASTGALTNAENYIHYGVREHAMGAIMNGLALGGLRPYGSTFLVFSDYMRGAVRLAALMNLPVLFVFSHDSVALGQDGPTHQPVEQLPSLRLIPNLKVFRPCNMSEMFLCLKHHYDNGGPAAMILSRQSFARVPDSRDAAVYGYIAAGSRGADVKLIATGSEVALAMAVRGRLENSGVKAAVISAPSLELLLRGSEDAQKIIGGGLRVWIEASAQHPPFAAQIIVRINGFGESCDGVAVYKKYGFDADEIADKIMKGIKIAA